MLVLHKHKQEDFFHYVMGNDRKYKPSFHASCLLSKSIFSSYDTSKGHKMSRFSLNNDLGKAHTRS